MWRIRASVVEVGSKTFGISSGIVLDVTLVY
jgi:hypothetical protein